MLIAALLLSVALTWFASILAFSALSPLAILASRPWRRIDDELKHSTWAGGLGVVVGGVATIIAVWCGGKLTSGWLGNTGIALLALPGVLGLMWCVWATSVRVTAWKRRRALLHAIEQDTVTVAKARDETARRTLTGRLAMLAATSVGDSKDEALRQPLSGEPAPAWLIEQRRRQWQLSRLLVAGALLASVVLPPLGFGVWRVW